MPTNLTPSVPPTTDDCYEGVRSEHEHAVRQLSAALPCSIAQVCPVLSRNSGSSNPVYLPEFLKRLRAHLGLCCRVVLQGFTARRIRAQSEPLRNSRRGRYGAREIGRHLLLGEVSSSRSSSSGGRGCSGNCSGRGGSSRSGSTASSTNSSGSRCREASVVRRHVVGVQLEVRSTSPDAARLHTRLGKSGPGTVLLRRQSRMHGPTRCRTIGNWSKRYNRAARAIFPYGL